MKHYKLTQYTVMYTHDFAFTRSFTRPFDVKSITIKLSDEKQLKQYAQYTMALPGNKHIISLRFVDKLGNITDVDRLKHSNKYYTRSHLLKNKSFTKTMQRYGTSIHKTLIPIATTNFTYLAEGYYFNNGLSVAKHFDSHRGWNVSTPHGKYLIRGIKNFKTALQYARYFGLLIPWCGLTDNEAQEQFKSQVEKYCILKYDARTIFSNINGSITLKHFLTPTQLHYKQLISQTAKALSEKIDLLGRNHAKVKAVKQELIDYVQMYKLSDTSLNI